MRLFNHVLPHSTTGLETTHVFPIKTLTPTKTFPAIGARMAFSAFAALLPLGLNAATMVGDSYNVEGVANGVIPAICQTAFLLETETVITSVATYHYNRFPWLPPVNLYLRETNGAEHGPYQATPSGADQIANVPNLLLKPGWVQVLDSDPSTWSQNQFSCGCGFARLFGNPVGTSITTIFNNFNTGGVITSPFGPPTPTTFQVASPIELDNVALYTFNSTAPPGTITLSSNGQQYATFPAITLPSPGPNNPSGGHCYLNSQWLASPTNVMLSPGNYTITMSDPGVWSFNSQTSPPNEGFAKIAGH